MGMFDKLMVAQAGNGVLPGINMNDPRVARAAALLRSQGVPVTRASLAEAMALEAGGPAAPPPAPAPYMGQRTAPPGSAEEAAEREIERKRRQGPPPEMMRGRRGAVQ